VQHISKYTWEGRGEFKRSEGTTDEKGYEALVKIIMNQLNSIQLVQPAA
jgi:hypothetical protein